MNASTAPPPAARKRRWTDKSVGEHLRAAGFQANEGNNKITVVLADDHYVEVWGGDGVWDLEHAGDAVVSGETNRGLGEPLWDHADAKALVEHLVSIRDRRTG